MRHCKNNKIKQTILFEKAIYNYLHNLQLENWAKKNNK